MAILPIQTNDSTQPLRGLDMKLVRFDYMEIHPIHVCLSHAVNYSLSLLIWHHWTKMNAVQSIISNRNMSLPSAYEANSKQGRFASICHHMALGIPLVPLVFLWSFFFFALL